MKICGCFGKPESRIDISICHAAKFEIFVSKPRPPDRTAGPVAVLELPLIVGSEKHRADQPDDDLRLAWHGCCEKAFRLDRLTRLPAFSSSWSVRRDAKKEVPRLAGKKQEVRMQIGFNAPISGHLISPESLLQIVTEGEALGFDHLTLGDHIMVPRDLESKYPYSDTGEFPPGPKAAWLEQLTTTAFIAAATKKIRFVLSVLVVPHRPAVLTAKLLATIDFLSNGRLTWA
jgi:Luciferase-like monooxygenase